MPKEDTLDLSIIIPFYNKSSMTLDCVNSLQKYGGKIKELLLVSNNSSPAELDAVKQAVKSYPNTKVLEYNEPFNFQKINNWAISKSKGKVVMMLNNDIELNNKSIGLIERMYEQSMDKKTGAVGCVLLYEDDKTIQHAGVYLVAGGTADHLYLGRKYSSVISKIETNKKYINIKNDLPVSAVTAAAVMIERRKFDEVNGMDEAFIICGGDVDICLRLNESGYTNTLLGGKNGYMIHKESKSRSMLSVPYIDFIESYRSYITHFDLEKGDPYITKEELAHVQ